MDISITEAVATFGVTNNWSRKSRDIFPIKLTIVVSISCLIIFMFVVMFMIIIPLALQQILIRLGLLLGWRCIIG
jgi:hypothetical protein